MTNQVDLRAEAKFPSSRWGEVVWWMVFLAKIAIGGLFALGLVVVFMLLPILVIAWLHVDAIAERRYPWLSWPLMIAFDVCALRFIVQTHREERRLRRELPDTIRSRVLRCPLCGGPLPAWTGKFEECPIPPFHQDGWDHREGCFRLACDPCGREVWFVAWINGSVRSHAGWLWENKLKYLEPG